MKKTFLALLLSIALVNLSFAQLIQKIDSIIQTGFKDPNAPGGAFLVSRKGNIIYERAFGKANLELNVGMTTDNVFQIGSMTKQFTAVSILILEAQGKLKVGDPVSKYIPDYPLGNSITIHQLLTHTSGIKDFTKLKALSEIAQKEMSPK